MIALAKQIDRGPWWAAGIAAGLLLLALAVPMLAVLSGGAAVVSFVASLLMMAGVVGSAACIAYAVLRRGGSAIAQVALPCVVILVAASMLLLRSPVTLPVVALVLWLPAILAAAVLRSTTNLAIALLVTGLAGVAALLLMELATGGTVAFWDKQFALMFEQIQTGIAENPALASAYGDSLSDTSLLDTLRESLATMMAASSGMVAMSFGVAALFLARYWQAVLVNPGGFGSEFRTLDFGRPIALALAVLLAVCLFASGAFALGITLIIITLLCLQGLAVAHAVVKERGMNSNWLAGLYVLLLIPHTTLLLAALGLLDSVHPLRQR
ncbi:MAG: hypothetical protein CSB44_05495 [Gammaproteobacteria bacterium]|nr:MAG: hypothetical protein CSB44_05495 [Gammaproteobacteria bacterium]